MNIAYKKIQALAKNQLKNKKITEDQEEEEVVEEVEVEEDHQHEGVGDEVEEGVEEEAELESRLHHLPNKAKVSQFIQAWNSRMLVQKMNHKLKKM